jgi:NCS1 family nucleobase:cation symporter-1
LTLARCCNPPLQLEQLPAGGVARGVLADRFRPLRGGLFALLAEQDFLGENLLAAGAGSVIGAQVAMVLGVFAAASANGQFAGHEVAYIVGLGGTGATAALLYFSIAFGKVTISTLNSYGSFMCIATIISGFRGI